MKLATWNVNSIKVRLPQLLDWLAAAQPDVVCLQELKSADAGFPLAALADAGYACAVNGQKTYNGVAILARSPLAEIAMDLPGFADEQKRVIAAGVQGLRVVCVYCPNGQAVGSEKYEYKLRWFAGLREYLRVELTKHPRLVVAGDFNVAPEDRDVHDPKAWEGQVHVSDPERAAWRELLALGLQDSFRLFEQPEKIFSWWDYRMLGFRRNAGLRIDHILLSPPLAQGCTASTIDKAPRKLERPSDHAPAVVELRVG
ncbi:MAG: exodeoxyribonuclease III [Betaproteobacteria bacterium]|nr:exodeoxyribonuclease III [Betaproteobacteria bacterium]